MPQRRTLTSVAAVLFLGLCAALPFHRPITDRMADQSAGPTLREKDQAGQPPLRAADAPESSEKLIRDDAAPAESPPTPSKHKDTTAWGAKSSAPPPAATLSGGAGGGLPQAPRGRRRIRPMVRYLEHVVEDGDSLRQLAVDYLGRADRYTEIYALNRDKPYLARDILPIGVTLKIPLRDAPLADVQPPLGGPPSTLPASRPTAGPRAAGPAPASPGPSAAAPNSPPAPQPPAIGGTRDFS